MEEKIYDRQVGIKKKGIAISKPKPRFRNHAIGVSVRFCYITSVSKISANARAYGILFGKDKNVVGMDLRVVTLEYSE